MEIKCKRFLDNGKATFSILSWINDEFESFVLEDTFRTDKVKGKTRIPAGLYQLKFREVVTDMTRRYRLRYSWFKWHIELQSVPDYKAVYMHIGNYAKDTEGCLLLGFGCLPKENMIADSTAAFKSFYEKVSTILKSGEEIWIRIEDEQT